MSFSTCDLCDEYPHGVHVVELVFRDFGQKRRFHGRIVTVRCPEDNSLVRDLVNEAGHGSVLVIDGGGSLRRALLGDQLATRAVENGWEGVIVNGAVRDVELLGGMELGIKALGCVPLKTDKKGFGERDVPLRFGGVDFLPGEYLYADASGIVVSSVRLHATD